jgi:hypothetical protein
MEAATARMAFLAPRRVQVSWTVPSAVSVKRPETSVGVVVVLVVVVEDVELVLVVVEDVAIVVVAVVEVMDVLVGRS